MSRRGARSYHAIGHRDANEPAIKDALEARGFNVTQLQGKGVPDLLVSQRRGEHGAMWLIEVKQPKKGYTPAQIKFRETWQGPAIYCIRTVDEAMAFQLDHDR